MFSYDNSTSSHGATKGVASATLEGFELSRFSGTEGPEIANQLSTAIQITLGRINSIQFLTTPLNSLLAQIPQPKMKMQNSKAMKWKKKF